MAACIQHMRAHRPERFRRKDLLPLRESFGGCRPELALTSKRARKCRELRLPEDRCWKVWPLPALCVKDLTPAAIAEFLAAQVRAKCIALKTANRYPEVIGKLIAWAMKSGCVRMPLDRNPNERVERYREHAQETRYLTLEQIDE